MALTSVFTQARAAPRAALLSAALAFLLASPLPVDCQHTVPDLAFDRTPESANVVGQFVTIGIGWLPWWGVGPGFPDWMPAVLNRIIQTPAPISSPDAVVSGTGRHDAFSRTYPGGAVEEYDYACDETAATALSPNVPQVTMNVSNLQQYGYAVRQSDRGDVRIANGSTVTSNGLALGADPTANPNTHKWRITSPGGTVPQGTPILVEGRFQIMWKINGYGGERLGGELVPRFNPDGSVARDPQTGQILWRVNPIYSHQFRFTAAIDGNIVLAAAYFQGRLFVQVQERWNAARPSFYTGPGPDLGNYVFPVQAAARVGSLLEVSYESKFWIFFDTILVPNDLIVLPPDSLQVLSQGVPTPRVASGTGAFFWNLELTSGIFSGGPPAGATFGFPGPPQIPTPPNTGLAGFLNVGLQRPGDLNQDAGADVSDAVKLLLALFAGASDNLPCGDGTIDDPANQAILDVNGDGALSLVDAVSLLRHLFVGDPPPELGTECVAIGGCPDPGVCTD